MRVSTCFVLLCLSGTYLGLAWGYPLDFSGYSALRQSSNKEPPVPDFLSLLLDQYESQRVSDSIPLPFDPLDDVETDDYNLVERYVPEEYQFEDEFRGHPKYRLRDGELEDSRSKRQQGWYMQYGKRNSGFLPMEDDIFEDVPTKRQQGWHVQYGKRSDSDFRYHLL